ncbi:MAG: peptidoglycan editing factor PgeF [bacterium]
MPHGFTTRTAGVSAPPFDTLNLGRGVGDQLESVGANRTRVAAALGRRLDDHVEASQVHGSVTAVVGAAHRGHTIDGADGLATRDRRVLLAVHCADCVPILLADPVRGAVAAVHTGWRGTADGAAGAAVRTMADAFRSRSKDLLAAIGPAIGPCCYAVDAPVLERFARWPWRDRVLTPSGPGQWKLDLWEANRTQLQEAGIPSDGIATAALCTSCHPALFFSHRRDGRSGRMGALVTLP